MSRRDHLREIRLRLAELLADGTLAMLEEQRPYPLSQSERPVCLVFHVGALLELADKLERWTDEQKRTAQYQEAAGFIASELERVMSWLAAGDRS
jgi:hypothetical protein